MGATRDRLVAEGMRLFGEKGYSGTSVAEIEAAVGLSPGSGGMYKHFSSKQELLDEGVARVLESNRDLTATLAKLDPAEDDLRDTLTAVAQLGLVRLEHDRDVNRLLFRGLERFTELFSRFGDEEIRRTNVATEAALKRLGRNESTDWLAVATVLVGATSHFWLLSDLFGTHPTGIDADRFVAAVVAIAAAFIEKTRTPDADGHNERRIT